jgi:lysophospholipase L1-like esterase
MMFMGQKGKELTTAQVEALTFGQAMPNKIAILGNSITFLGACPRNLLSATGWLPGATIATSATTFPVYWDVTRGVAPIKWVASTGGVTGTLEPDWPHYAPAGTTVQDGTVVWTATAIGGGGNNTSWAFGWWHIAQALSGQRLDEAVLMGRSGRQSNEILSYLDRILAVPGVGTVFFANMFENDCWPGSAPTLATIAQRWDAFVTDVQKCRAAGKRVMVQTVLPNGNIDGASLLTSYTFGNGSRAWLWLNNKIRELARAYSDIVLWDAAQVYVDANPANPVWPENTATFLSTTGSGQQLKLTDGVHPNAVGHWRLGQSLAQVLAANFPARPIFTNALDPYTNAVNPLNFGTAGTLTNVSGGGAAPNNLTLNAASGTAASCVASKVPRTDGAGELLQLVYVAAAADGAILSWTTAQTPAFAAGSVVQAFGEIKILANPTLLTWTQFQVSFTGATERFTQNAGFSGTDQDWGQAMTTDTMLTLKTLPAVVPAGMASLSLQMKAVGRGAALYTPQFGRMQVKPVTVAALA